jgi:hypothetical protein
MMNKVVNFAAVKTINLILIVMASSLLLTQARLSAEDTRTRAFYESCIDQVISKWERQAILSDERSERIRQDAAMACLKAGFYRTHKEPLLSQMVAMDLGEKKAAVDCFLVKSFHDFLKGESGRFLVNGIRAQK